MKGLIILANGFEDTEALATIDVLKRSKLHIDKISLQDTLDIVSQYDLKIKADFFLRDVNPNDYDFLVIPGGRAVSLVLDKSKELEKLISNFVSRKKLIAAICAGPSQVGKLGYYQNEEYTCFPGTENKIIGGKYLANQGVVRSTNFITAKAMAYSIEFGLEIVEHLQGKAQRDVVSHSVYGEL